MNTKRPWRLECTDAGWWTCYSTYATRAAAVAVAEAQYAADHHRNREYPWPIRSWRLIHRDTGKIMPALTPDSTERVLCASIYVDDGVEHAGRSHNHPRTGLLFNGWRHNDCFVTLNAWQKSLSVKELTRIAAIFEHQLRGSRQGFLTSHGRFVDRQQAAVIAFAAGQVPTGVDSLDSEDLYPPLGTPPRR